jgi:hypothetical protein
MVANRDWAKKMYRNNLSFADNQNSISNKEVWNSILNNYPNLAEFFLTGRGKNQLTALERSIAEFLKQSELVKPYQGSRPFAQMDEDDWPAAEVTPHRPIRPPIVRPPGPEDPDPPPPPWHRFCHAISNSCWCPEDTGAWMPFNMWGSHPIIAIYESRARYRNITGMGSSSLAGEFLGPDVPSGKGVGTAYITMEVTMSLQTESHGVVEAAGRTCVKKVKLWQCDEDECCADAEMEADAGNPTTIGGSSSQTMQWSGGTPEYTVSVSGSDFWLDAAKTKTEITTNTRSVTVYTGAAACGPGTISVTDNCDNQIDMELRSTAGQWGTSVTGACGVPVGTTLDGGGCLSGTIGGQRVLGKIRQKDRIATDWTNVSICNSGSCEDCNVEPECLCIGPCGTGTRYGSTQKL